MKPIVIILSIMLVSNLASAQDYAEKREQMVNTQIIERGIRDIDVIDALRSVERHRFVPSSYRNKAYSDNPLPIGHEQTISQPYIVALMTELLDIEQGDKILEIGTGSGYQAAVLSEITPYVYSIEIVTPLAKEAQQTLRENGYQSIHLKTGDGYKGWKEHAPFDGIIVTCSPSDIPQPLKDQLAEGGRMVIPVGGAYIQKLVLLEKQKGTIRRKHVSNVRFVPMVDDKGKRY